MDMKTAVTASRLGVPVIHNGIEYERITARITRLTPEGEKYSLELADYSGSAVIIAPVDEVEAASSCGATAGVRKANLLEGQKKG